MKTQLEPGSFAEKEHKKAERRKKKAQERYRAKIPRCTIRWNGRYFMVEDKQINIHPLSYPGYIASMIVTKKETAPRFLTIIASNGQSHRVLIKREDDAWFLDRLAVRVMQMTRETGDRVRIYSSPAKYARFKTRDIKDIAAINYNPKKGLVTFIFKVKKQETFKLSLITLRLILWIFMRNTRKSLEVTKNGHRGKIVKFRVI